MVFKHNKQPFADGDYYKFAFKHLGQLDCGGHLASCAEFSSFKGIPEKHLVSDGDRGGSSSYSQSKLMPEGDTNDVLSDIPKEEAGYISNCSAASALINISSLPCFTGSTGEVRSDHSKRPFSDNGPCQLASKRLRQVDQYSKVDSFEGISSITSSAMEPGTSVAALEAMEAGYISNCSAASALSNISSLPCIRGSTGEVRSDHSKRPFSDNGPCQLVSKRLRQVDQYSKVDSFEGISSINCSAMEPGTSVAALEVIVSKKVAAFSEYPGGNAPFSISNQPWLTCSTTEDTRFEPPCRLPFFPGYFEDGHQANVFSQSEEICSPVFDYPPRKLVPIGQNHQADIPLWRPQGTRYSLDESDSSYSASDSQLMVDKDCSDKWMGTCVLPMPDSNSSASEARVGNIKTECNCPDEGSIRCTRQHVIEARERLKEMLGEDRFRELGFCDMGEVVAHKWTEEEEQLFHEVLITNSFSLGKNFWNYLPRAFPYRSSKELVSYYFNVFMLRKRAQQNRSDPLNVDSDDDEWQESNDGGFATTEDEDSVVESPVDNAFPHEGTEDGDDSDDCGIASEDDEEFYGASERCIGDRSEFIPEVQPVEKNSQNGGGEDQDAQDDSCTSYESQHNKINYFSGPFDFVETHDSLVGHRQYTVDDLRGLSDHKYIVGHCDPKTWDISYVPRTDKDVEFLPTSNVIEVFGKGDWEYETGDNRGIIK